MREIFTARTLADAYIVRDVLQQEGVPAVIRNEHLVGAAGDVPITEALPTVSVADGDVARALFLLQEHLRDDDAAEALDEMASRAEADDDGGEAHAAMTEVYVAARRLARDGRHGASVEVIRHHGEVMIAAAVPFGVEPRAWERSARLVAAVIEAAAAGDAENTATYAAQLRDALTSYV